MPAPKNYIKRLEWQNRVLEARLAMLEEKLNEFHGHLSLPKFAGAGNDYIQTQDVRNWLQYIVSDGADEVEQALALIEAGVHPETADLLARNLAR